MLYPLRPLASNRFRRLPQAKRLWLLALCCLTLLSGQWCQASMQAANTVAVVLEQSDGGHDCCPEESQPAAADACDLCAQDSALDKRASATVDTFPIPVFLAQAWLQVSPSAPQLLTRYASSEPPQRGPPALFLLFDRFLE